MPSFRHPDKPYSKTENFFQEIFVWLFILTALLDTFAAIQALFNNDFIEAFQKYNMSGQYASWKGFLYIPCMALFITVFLFIKNAGITQDNNH